MVKIILKAITLKLMVKLKQQFLGTAIETKFLPTYVSSFLDKLESDVLKFQELTPFNWYCSNDNVFFIWSHGD